MFAYITEESSPQLAALNAEIRKKTSTTDSAADSEEKLRRQFKSINIDGVFNKESVRG
jgi:hypothetical protein